MKVKELIHSLPSVPSGTLDKSTMTSGSSSLGGVDTD